jgi:hypothetical protein
MEGASVVLSLPPTRSIVRMKALANQSYPLRENSSGAGCFCSSADIRKIIPSSRRSTEFHKGDDDQVDGARLVFQMSR